MIRACGFILLFLFLFISAGEAADTGCFFLRENSQLSQIKPNAALLPVRSGDFLIYAMDPESILRHRKILERSRHFLETELGWKFPATRRELNQPVLEIHVVSGPREFTATVRPGPVIFLNETVTASPDFAAIWIHQLAHAAQMAYRHQGEYWFYEATAGWMETQFGSISRQTKLAQAIRLKRPDVSINHNDPVLALGVSRFLEILSNPYRDVVRQVWEQWKYSQNESVLDVFRRVLALNHLPALESYLLNYYLRSVSERPWYLCTTDLVLSPYSAAVFEGKPNRKTGGMHVSFQPAGAVAYSGWLVHYSDSENEGTVAIKQNARDPWQLRVPCVGMSRFKLVIVNPSPGELRGSVQQSFDSTIPAVLEYFHATPGEAGVQLEWKTAKENGVAFWNLYRIQQGTREKMNSFPIPASIDSTTGVYYMYVDSANGAFYSLEAITSEGFPGSAATTELSQ